MTSPAAVTSRVSTNWALTPELDAADLKAWRKQHRFHPHQLRHTAATRFRRESNLDVA